MSYQLILSMTLRLFLALALGFAIGFERKIRFKEAGMRTHTIVCGGACLYMLISLYAFNGEGDPARVAAQIVPGIGFIGAGIIFYHKEIVRGLTTAAGIWATAAIGMAVGAGWYIVSIIATCSIILIQCIMHLPFKFFHVRKFIKINLSFTDDDGNVAELIKKLFSIERFNKISAVKDGDNIVYNVTIILNHVIDFEQIRKTLKENASIISITCQDDEF